MTALMVFLSTWIISSPKDSDWPRDYHNNRPFCLDIMQHSIVQQKEDSLSAQVQKLMQLSTYVTKLSFDLNFDCLWEEGKIAQTSSVQQSHPNWAAKQTEIKAKQGDEKWIGMKRRI